MTPPAIHIDFETRSTVDLVKCGVEKYAEHPTTWALCLCWAQGDGPVVRVTGDELKDVWSPRLDPLFVHVEAGGIVYAHNARFELYIWRMMAARFNWPELKIEQLRCTMAMARALSLPGALGQLAAALRLPVAKDDDGRRLMLKMCKPRKPRKNEPQDAIFWHEDPADVVRLVEYCADDVIVEREIEKTLSPLIASEQDLWALDQQINDRGVFLDIPSVENLTELSAREKIRLGREMYKVTGGRVASPNAQKALLEWLAERGTPLADIRKGTVEAALKADWPADVRRVLEIRKEAAKASTAKLAAMEKGACRDSRARGLLEYHGAGTGRWAGRRVQTQNMPRTPDDFEVEDAENIFDWAKFPTGELGIRAEYGSALDGVSWSLRSLLSAAPGNQLLCADYSNIEGRVLAWLAGEDWKLRAFEEFDAGSGHDLYKLAYSKSFGVAPADVTKPQRQIGKVQELALGYQGGHGAFLSMGGNYGIDLDQIAAAVRDAVDGETWAFAIKRYWSGAHSEAEEFLADARAKVAAGDDTAEDDEELSQFAGVEELAAIFARRSKFDLGPDQWAAIRVIVDGWRAAHPNIVQFWRNLERAAIDAVNSPGNVFPAGQIRYRKTGDILYCRLPSGRALAYPFARVVHEPNKWKPETPQAKVIFEGVDGKTKRWCKQKLYGGLSAENVTQAAARDILADAVKRLERRGFPVVMHVHDEIVCELEHQPADNRYAEFLEYMAAKEPWAAGLPVAVAGWKGRRYRK